MKEQPAEEEKIVDELQAETDQPVQPNEVERPAQEQPQPVEETNLLDFESTEK